MTTAIAPTRRWASAVALVLVPLALLGCSGGTPSASAPSAAAVTSTTAGPAPTSTGPSSGQPEPSSASGGVAASAGDPTKPCDLLTRTMAEEALGVPVNDGVNYALGKNYFCEYDATGVNDVVATITTYTGAGHYSREKFTETFGRDGKPVSVGDVAFAALSIHTIQVQRGDLQFAINLAPPGSAANPPDVVEAQLVALARAVLAGG